MKKIKWPKYNDKGEIVKEGSIDGISMGKIFKQCEKEADEYYEKKYCKTCGNKSKEKQ